MRLKYEPSSETLESYGGPLLPPTQCVEPCRHVPHDTRPCFLDTFFGFLDTLFYVLDTIFCLQVTGARVSIIQVLCEVREVGCRHASSSSSSPPYDPTSSYHNLHLTITCI